MKDFKGTPGPWELAKFKTKVLQRPKEKWMPIQLIAFVCEVPMTREERTANAKAIAAVPAMIEALRPLEKLADEILPKKPNAPDDLIVWQFDKSWITIGDLKAAKAALSLALD